MERINSMDIKGVMRLRAVALRDRIKHGRLFGTDIDEQDTDMLLVAVYELGRMDADNANIRLLNLVGVKDETNCR